MRQIPDIADWNTLGNYNVAVSLVNTKNISKETWTDNYIVGTVLYFSFIITF